MNNEGRIIHIIQSNNVESFCLTLKESMNYEKEIENNGFYPKSLEKIQGINYILWEKVNENRVNK